MNAEVVLDSIQLITKQIESTYEAAFRLVGKTDTGAIKKLAIFGMGGSRFPILMVKFLTKPHLIAPIEIISDYIVPSYVDSETLVVYSSYSGGTEEVLHALLKLNKDLAPIQDVYKQVVFTSGGKLAKYAARYNIPLIQYDISLNPSGQPRMGVGFPFGAFLGILLAFNMVSNKNQYVFSLERMNEFIFKSNVENSAQELAERVFKKVPIYVVAEHLVGVGNMLANQTNETAKTFAEFHVLPELNHHLLEGFKNPSDLKEKLHIVLFKSELYSPRIRQRVQLTADALRRYPIDVSFVDVKGQTALEQVVYLMYFSSYLSFHLSKIYKEDPTAIPYVDYFKQKLGSLPDIE